MIKEVINTIRENSMFDIGDKIIVAVSGGPDSICLLHILNELRNELQVTLVGAHVNHCLRGEEADKDEDYARKICKDLNIDFYSKRVDVHKLSKERNISCEMAGREVRYEFFQELMVNLNANKIALAHNANDQAETILMRIMRGTGIEGLVGIKPVRDGIYVRPIIHISRKDIEQYCENNHISPRIDKTNLENIYARNKVRLDLIPYIQENFNKDIIKTLNRLSDLVKKDNDYLECVSTKQYKKYCDISGEKVIICKKAFLEHEAILTRIIRRALLELKGNLYNLEKIHISSIIDFQNHETGKSIMLPQDIVVENCYGDIHIYKNIKDIKDIEIYNNEYDLTINKENYIGSLNKVVKIKVQPRQQCIEFKRSEHVKYFDYDKITQPITFRYRRDGDKFMPLGMTGNKKLKDLFMDLKIPKSERHTVPLICFGSDIGWIVGYRVSEKFKVSKDTKNILQIIIESED